jgi:CheY-like chemotaxis protein
MLRRLIGERYRLETEVPEGLPSAMVDASMVQQVVLNLVVNARDAMPDGGTIGLALGTRTLERGSGSEAGPGMYVTLAVSDTGVGMDMRTVDRIYEPFFTTKEDGKGTGLGLAMVHGIVRQHGGTIELETAPGRGTAFTVLLPATSLRPESGSGEDELGEELRGSERVLVVEDEEVVRDLVVEILRSAGYSVHAASSPGEALSLSDGLNRPVQLLLTDVVMPEMEGFELYRRIREERRRIRVLFMSGYSYDAARGAGVPVEDAVFLSKPFTARELLRKVREAL